MTMCLLIGVWADFIKDLESTRWRIPGKIMGYKDRMYTVHICPVFVRWAAQSLPSNHRPSTISPICLLTSPTSPATPWFMIIYDSTFHWLIVPPFLATKSWKAQKMTQVFRWFEGGHRLWLATRPSYHSGLELDQLVGVEFSSPRGENRRGWREGHTEKKL